VWTARAGVCGGIEGEWRVRTGLGMSTHALLAAIESAGKQGAPRTTAGKPPNSDIEPPNYY